MSDDLKDRLRTAAVSSDPEVAFNAALNFEAADGIEALEYSLQCADEAVKSNLEIIRDLTEQREALERENERLKGMVKTQAAETAKAINYHIEKHEHLERENERLRAALGFYADHENWWGTYIASSKSPMVEDWGDPCDEYPDGKPGNQARAALKGETDAT